MSSQWNNYKVEHPSVGLCENITTFPELLSRRVITDIFLKSECVFQINCIFCIPTGNR